MHGATDDPQADMSRPASSHHVIPIALQGPLARVAGWGLVALGVVLLPLPGPGSLVILAGVRVLVPHHAWAARTYDETRERMVRATAAGVATWPRAALSVLGPVWLAALTLAYAADLQLGSFSILGLRLGPGLPLRSTATTVGLAVSALATAALVVVALRQWGPHLPICSDSTDSSDSTDPRHLARPAVPHESRARPCRSTAQTTMQLVRCR